MDDREHQLGVLDSVIELFETKFVELNDYMNNYDCDAAVAA